MKLLIEFGFDIKADRNGGRNALEEAIMEGHYEVTEIILQVADQLGNKDELINKVSAHGYTPLLYAAMKENIDIVCLLFDNGADIRLIQNPSKSIMNWLGSFGIQQPRILNILLSELSDKLKEDLKLLKTSSSKNNESKPAKGLSPDNSILKLQNKIPEFTPGFIEELNQEEGNDSIASNQGHDDHTVLNGESNNFEPLDHS